VKRVIKAVVYGLAWGLSFLLATAFTLVGVAICLTIVGIPFGVVIIYLGCSPLAVLVARHHRKKFYLGMWLKRMAEEANNK
jgi:hypothetical protein